MQLRFDTSLCEPLRAWNRIEPRPRQEDFSQALQARVHDPLWFLTRQWQFGEFKGEDTGSAVFAKLEMEIERVGRVRARQADAEAYVPDRPLEARVERMDYRLDFRTRAAAGEQWLQFMDAAGGQYNTGSPAHPYRPEDYRALFLEHFPLPGPDVDETDTDTVRRRAADRSYRPAHQFLSAARARAVDGGAVWTLLAASPGPVTWPMTLPSGHAAWLEQAGRGFQRWFENLHGLEAARAQPAWNPTQLEYQFACSTTGADGRQTVLAADDYSQGRLDWFAFDVDPNVPDLGPSSSASAETRALTVIPTEARFGGMPNARWWEFENGAIDLGNVRADTTDLAKILLVEFALVYSNDWFLLPVKLPVGSLAATRGILVTDVFGVRTLVEPAGAEDGLDWSAWSLFHLSVKPKTGETATGADARLFLPPAVFKPLESEALEEVRLVRDETANQVWGVETRVPDCLGGSRDGVDAARQLRDYFERLDTPGTSPAARPGAALAYRLGRGVPANWIPFLPVHQPGSRRTVRLQRGSMPRFFRQEISPVRPLTSLLRPGLNPNDTQAEPYFVHEEEVTRAGTQLTATHQRVRWLQGAVCSWVGLRKRTGRGAGGSGLAFDRIEDTKQ